MPLHLPTWPRPPRGKLEPNAIANYANGVRKAVYRDPDGNEARFGGAPLDTGSSA
jgi:hypothetical protein